MRDDVDEVLARYDRWKAPLARVAHGGVARLLDVGLTDEGLVYAASQFVAGWPLATIDDRPSIGPDARVEIARQLSATVGAIHAAGVAHLALTASNVRVSATSGVQATILGLGIRLIIDGADASPDADRRALEHLHRQLGLAS